MGQSRPALADGCAVLQKTRWARHRCNLAVTCHDRTGVVDTDLGRRHQKKWFLSLELSGSFITFLFHAYAFKKETKNQTCKMLFCPKNATVFYENFDQQVRWPSILVHCWFTLKPVGHQSTNCTLRICLIVPIDFEISDGVTSPRYSRQHDIYLKD